MVLLRILSLFFGWDAISLLFCPTVARLDSVIGWSRPLTRLTPRTLRRVDRSILILWSRPVTRLTLRALGQIGRAICQVVPFGPLGLLGIMQSGIPELVYRGWC